MNKRDEERMVNYEYDGYYDGEPVCDIAYCPTCGYEFEDGDIVWRRAKYCPECGQKIRWEVADE